MKTATLFDEVYAARVTALHNRFDPSAQRWQVWHEQSRQGHAQCFRTEKRHFCKEYDCPWRSACLSRRAEWKR